jgi:predicted kinase
MVKIIIVFGLPGSGKSYFAEALSRRLAAVHVNSDQVRNALSARGKYSLEDKLRVYHAMAELSNDLLVEGKSVVVDATFYLRVMVNVFTGLAKKRSCPILFIKIVADEALIKERLSKPRKDSEADYDVYLKIKEKFEEVQEPYLTVRSENSNIDNMIELSLEYISSPHD